MIHIVAKPKAYQNIRSKYPNAIIIDFASRGNLAIDRFNPYYPYRDIPVPNSGGLVAESVGSVWHGLKVFEKRDICEELICNYSFDHERLNGHNHGDYLGHRYGIHGLGLLNISDARRRILVPTYRWVLDYKVQDAITEIREANKNHDIIFIVNQVECSEIRDYMHPISHVSLIKAYIDGLFPYEDVFDTLINHHHYIGRKYIQWTTVEKRPKMIKPFVINLEPTIPFDIV